MLSVDAMTYYSANVSTTDLPVFCVWRMLTVDVMSH